MTRADWGWIAVCWAATLGSVLLLLLLGSR